MYLTQRPAYLSTQRPCNNWRWLIAQARAWADRQLWWAHADLCFLLKMSSLHMAGKGREGSSIEAEPPFDLHAVPSLIPTLETGKFGQRRRLSKHPLAKISSKSPPSPNPIYPSVRHSRLITLNSLCEENVCRSVLLLSLEGVTASWWIPWQMNGCKDEGGEWEWEKDTETWGPVHSLHD